MTTNWIDPILVAHLEGQGRGLDQLLRQEADGRPINDLLDEVGGKGLDLLSLGAAQVADIDFSRHRPAFLLVTGDAEVILAGQSYILQARVGEERLYADKAASSGKPRVRTFDIFNTLLSRRCVTPDGIRAQVAAKIGVPEFPNLRRDAELAIEHSDYSLDDIYAELARRLNLTPEQAEFVKTAEIETELANVIPIQENLERLRPGDVLVSDMYLGPEIIRAMLDRAGALNDLGLVVTARGKATGKIWPPLLARFEIERHLGDDARTDIASPQRFGIPVERTLLADMSEVEGFLAQQGLPQLACLLREARLSSWHEDDLLRRLQIRQISVNLPILLLSSMRVVRLAEAFKIERLLFSARDSNLWLEAFRLLAGHLGKNFDARYFHTNRLLRSRPSPAALDYAREQICENSMILDVCGTGWSTSLLLDRLGVETAHLFLIHDMSGRDIRERYEQMRRTASRRPIHSVVYGGDEQTYNNGYLEMLNFADHPPVMDLLPLFGQVIPVMAEDDRPPAMRRAVKLQRQAFLDALALARNYDLSELQGLDESRLETVVGTLYAFLGRQGDLTSLFMDYHLAEDRRVMAALRAG